MVSTFRARAFQRSEEVDIAIVIDQSYRERPVKLMPFKHKRCAAGGETVCAVTSTLPRQIVVSH